MKHAHNKRVISAINHLKYMRNNSPVHHPKGFSALLVGDQRTFFKVSYLTHSFETFFAKWNIFPQRMENTGDKKTSLRSKTHVLMLEACCFSFFSGMQSLTSFPDHLGILSTCGDLSTKVWDFTFPWNFPGKYIEIIRINLRVRKKNTWNFSVRSCCFITKLHQKCWHQELP